MSPAGTKVVAATACAVALFGASAARASTGALTQLGGTSGCLAVTGFGDGCGAASATSGGDAMAASPDGKSVYFAGSSLDEFSRNGTTGALTEVGCFNSDASDGCTQATAFNDTSFTDVAVSPDGKSVYFADNETLLVFSRNTTTGALTQLGATAGCVSGDGSDGNGHASSCVTDSASGGFVGQWVTVSPDGATVYSGTQGINSVISVFSRNSSTGALTQLSAAAGCVSNSNTPTCTQGTAVDATSDLVVSPDGKFAYVVSSTDNSIDAFSRNTSTGALTELTGSARCVVLDTTFLPQCAAARALRGDQPSALITPDGRFLYVVTSDPGGEGGGVVAFSRDATTGALTQLAGTAGCLTESGDDGASGACASGRALSGAEASAISADGENLYVTASTDNAVDVFSVALGSGALTQLAGTAGCHVESIGTAGCTQDRGLLAPDGVAVAPDGGHLYVGGDGAVAAFTRTEAPARFTVAGSVSAAGGGSVSAASSGSEAVCSGGTCTVDAGDTVTLTAQPASLRVFNGWSGACAGQGATCTLSGIQADASAEAAFTTIAGSVPPQSGFHPPPSSVVNPVIHQLAGHHSGFYCGPGGSCGSLSGLQVGQCASAIGGNSDLAITAGCLKLKAKGNKPGLHLWIFTAGQVFADGVTFTGNGIEVDMLVDAAGAEHFSVSGSSVKVSFEDVDLDQGSTTWYFDPLASGGGYGTAWGHSAGQRNQTNLPVPSSSNLQGLPVVGATPPTFKSGKAETEVTPKAPAEVGGQTTVGGLAMSNGTVQGGISAATGSGPALGAGSPHDIADNCGTNLAGPLPTGPHALAIHFPSLAIGGLGITDGTLTLNGLGHFVAKGTSHFPDGFGQGTSLRGVVDVLGGRLRFACIQGFNPPAAAPDLPVTFVDMHLGILTSPQLIVEGGAHVRSTDQLPLVNEYPFDATADARVTLPDLQGDPWGAHITGSLSLLGHHSSSTTLDYWSTGYASISGTLDPIVLFGKLNIGQFSFDAAEDGSGNWFAEGNSAISYSDYQLAAAETLLSNLGVGVCGTDAGVSVALSSTWSGNISASFFSCDGLNNVRPTVLPTCAGLQTLLHSGVPFIVSLAQTALAAHQCVDTGAGAASARVARSAPAGGVLTARVSGRPPSEEFIFHGDTGAPVVVLYGPDGTAVDTATSPPIGQNAVVTRDAASKTTTIAVRRPRAGAWLVKVAAGSPGVSSFDSAAGLPAPSVHASVGRGHGTQRVLRYRVTPRPGQKVSFAERGAQSGRLIGVAHGSHGAIRFTPSLGPAGTRQVTALIARGGVPVKRIKVATFHAPAPARLPAPRRLRLHRQRVAVRVSFARVRGSTHYLVSIKSSDHRTWSQTIKGTQLRIPMPSAGRIALTVSVSAVDRNGRVGRAGRARTRVQVAPPRLERTRRKKRRG